MAIKKVNTLQEYAALQHSAAESDVTLISEGNQVKYDGVNVEVSLPKENDPIFRDGDGNIHFISRDTLKQNLLPSDWTFLELFYYGWEDTDLVDMGDGILWAKRCIDLTQADKFQKTAFQYEGSFCSWGNTDMYNPNVNNSFSGVYNWGSVNGSEPYYEGQPYGNTPGAALTASFAPDSGNDAARENLGGNWRMPTSSRFNTLYSNCDAITADGEVVSAATSIAGTDADKRVKVMGINGLYLRSRITGRRLFFACSGLGTGASWIGRGSRGFFWSCTFVSARNARYLLFSNGGVFPQTYYDRYYGFLVRPVQNIN